MKPSYSLIISLALVACAPTTYGVDQVNDLNVLNTQQKDAHWNIAQNSNIDAIADDLLELAPGCGIGVMVNGEIEYLHGYGWANASKSSGDTRVYTELGDLVYDAGNGHPAKPDGQWHVGTVGPVGSVSKLYTALAAVKLARTDGTGWTMATTVDDVLTVTGDLEDVELEDLLMHRAGVGGR
jgi:CubicO group peptidase (beta-lactamase class C family)